MHAFIGRKSELQELQELLNARSARFLIVKGRRRIGKSRLLAEFAKNFKKIYWFSGLPPEDDTTTQDQKDEFARLLQEQGCIIKDKTDWGNLFYSLSKYTMSNRVLIVFDEISWMGSLDSTFLGKLKNAWDLYFKKNDKLVLAISGSISSWIDKNLMSHTGFVGRISYVLTLKELPLHDCIKFWNNLGKNISNYEKFKLLSITGGVPRYLEEIKPEYSAEKNIIMLCFNPGGVLFREFDNIFHDLFSKRSNLYKRIVQSIANGSKTQEDIYKKIAIKKSGDITNYLNDLVKSGFIARDYTWDISSGKQSKLSHYRISDNYIRFYLKYIEPNKDSIKKNRFKNYSLANFPGWATIMGFQFENLALANRELLHSILSIHPEDIVYDNPFFQTRTTRREGCQIDYMIQTAFNTLYICEIKFSKHAITLKVVKEMQEKVRKLKVPRGFSIRLILIHVNGVTEEVEDEKYFSKIIDFGKLLDE
ncbi:MAG: ATP-binding protein [Gammaproteobacteria bacterium]